jgi:hypothetical protein
MQLIATALVAIGGVVGRQRLIQRLERSAPRRTARTVFWRWLAANIFLGCQIVWILRPFVGTPALPVEFLRPNAFSGNIYETFYHVIIGILRQ